MHICCIKILFKLSIVLDRSNLQTQFSNFPKLRFRIYLCTKPNFKPNQNFEHGNLNWTRISFAFDPALILTEILCSKSPHTTILNIWIKQKNHENVLKLLIWNCIAKNGWGGKGFQKLSTPPSPRQSLAHPGPTPTNPFPILM